MEMIEAIQGARTSLTTIGPSKIKIIAKRDESGRASVAMPTIVIVTNTVLTIDSSSKPMIQAHTSRARGKELLPMMVATLLGQVQQRRLKAVNHHHHISNPSNRRMEAVSYTHLTLPTIYSV